VEVKQTGVIALLDEACFLVGTVTDKVKGDQNFGEGMLEVCTVEGDQ